MIKLFTRKSTFFGLAALAISAGLVGAPAPQEANAAETIVAGVIERNAAAAGETGGRTAALAAARAKAELAPAGRRNLHKRRRFHYAPTRRITAMIRFACLVEKASDAGGSPYPIVRIVNTGAGTIPAGRRIRWRLSTGKAGAFTLRQPVPPGHKSPAIDLAYHDWLEGLTCRAATL